MKSNSTSNTSDPTSALPGDRSSISHPTTKRCMECCALLPVEAFGLHKAGKDGYQPTCKECRSEYNAFRWTEKYGRRHKHHTYEYIRSVSRHNRLILEQLLQKGKTELRGFDPISKVEYKVYYGPAERHGMDSLACFTRNGMVYFDTAFSGVKDIQEKLVDYLKSYGVRLEWTDADVIASKTLIYYL